jgi:hypothetical protein
MAESETTSDEATAAAGVDAPAEAHADAHAGAHAGAAQAGAEAADAHAAADAPAEARAAAAPRPAQAHAEARAATAPRPAAAAATAKATGGALGAYEAVATSARLPDLVAITQRVVSEAAEARRSDWSFKQKASAAAEDTKLSRSDAETPYGNALKVLESGPEGEAEAALACALWAHAIAETKRDDDDRVAGDVLWLATHTAFDATPLLDRALGDEADELWKAISDRVKRVAEGRGGTLGRGEAVVGCAALAGSESPVAAKLREDLAKALKDPVLVRVLSTATSAGGEVRLEGESVPAPRGPVLTTILALTGLLFVISAVRLLMRFALAYRAPAEVSLSGAGVRVKTRTEMLGKVLREREHIIVRSGLVRVVREVRYPRAAFYAGLLALALGSYVGVRALVDGARSASPSLLLVGLLIVVLGIAADFVLGSLLPGARGRCRVSFVPRSGAVLCLGEVDAKRADEVITQALGR